MGCRMILVAVWLSAACTVPRTLPTPSTLPNATSAASAVTATASTARLTLHWMSLSLHSEPRYRVLYEGGSDASFTELRMVGPDGRIVATAASVPSADESLRLCGRDAPATYGPVRATLILPTQDVLHDVIQRPEAYPVEALVGGSWLRVALVNECHGQE